MPLLTVEPHMGRQLGPLFMFTLQLFMTDTSRRENCVAPESTELTQRLQQQLSYKPGQAISAVRDGYLDSYLEGLGSLTDAAITTAGVLTSVLFE